jgi:glutathione S-transferase
MADDLVLYVNAGYTSPYAFSAFVALEEKELPFATEVLDLAAGEHRRPEYAAASLTGRIPALRHGDFWLAESSAIDEYLEDVFPPPGHPRLYPASARDRARARMVQALLRSDLAPLRGDRPTSTLFRDEAAKPLTAGGQASAERLIQIAELLLAPGAAFLAGSAFGIADADLALMLQRLVHNGDPCPPRLASYARSIFARPSVRGWLARTRWQDR